jgi:hypothetical protein
MNEIITQWRDKVYPCIKPKERRLNLAQYLAANIGGKVGTRRTDISKVMKLRRKPSREFIIVVERWIKESGFDADGLQRRI